jgi:alkylhydroperoxidase/carboxymuconolactone decarboxylase family protein YurZ
MSIETEPGNQLVIHLTGEVIDLGDLPTVAQTLDYLRDIETQIKDAKRVLTDALEAESERQGSRTLDLGNVLVKLSTRERTEYDLEVLADMLRDAGLPEERLGELIVATVSYSLNQSVARQLRAANAAYGAALDSCRRTVPATVYATVKWKG